MSLEKAIQKLTNVIQAAARIDTNTTPIEYGPDGRMRPAENRGACVTRQVQVVTPGKYEQITNTYQCMCFYDKADGTRCVVRLTPGPCGKDEGPRTIPPDMPCITS
jgi:hypothetical protein